MGHGDPSTGQEQGQDSGTSSTFLSVRNNFFPKVLHRSSNKNPARASVHGGKGSVSTAGNPLQVRRSQV